MFTRSRRRTEALAVSEIVDELVDVIGRAGPVGRCPLCGLRFATEVAMSNHYAAVLAGRGCSPYDPPMKGSRR